MLLLVCVCEFMFVPTTQDLFIVCGKVKKKYEIKALD